jgi:pimeloyl-ACP methyl ester carboxylesterase
VSNAHAGTGTAHDPSPRIAHVTSADGTRIGFERSGEGPPLVLVHGTSADRTRWASIAPALEERFTLYAVDRRGRGLSPDTQPWAIEREFEDVAAVVASIDGPVDLLGHSYGALCAMEGALLAPNVRRIVLYEPPLATDVPFYEDDPRERLQAMIDGGDLDGALATFLLEVAGLSAGELEAMRASPSWAARLTVVHTVPREFADGDHVLDPRRFQRLTVPVLLLAGDQSSPALLAATRAAHEALPNSRVTVMPGQGHVAVTTAPELFSRLVLEFLSQPDDH